MKKIMLVCNAGMSTSLLVNKMDEASAAFTEEIEIFASPESEAQKMLGQVDVVLLGPQVSYIFSEFEQAAMPYGIPVAVIETIDYGRMDGKKVLDLALTLIDNNKKEENK